MTLPRSAADVVSDHVVFELESIDRAYCNLYVPKLQRELGVVGFVREHLGMPVASTAALADKTQAFYAEVRRFAARQQVPIVEFAKGQRKDDVMREHLARFLAAGRTDGVVFIGQAQEKVKVFATSKRRDAEGRPYPWITRASRVVTQWYFYCYDRCAGPFFLKYCGYFPYNAKLCCNGNEYAKAMAVRAGIGFTALDNGFAACDDVAAVQQICDSFDEQVIEALAARWLDNLPCPYSPADHAAGYRYEISVVQAEFSLTQVLDTPVAGRIFFEQAIRDNLAIGSSRPRWPDLRPAHHPHRAAGDPGQVPHPGHHRRGDPVPARRLQAFKDQAVPQGRTGAADRDHHQRHPRLRHRQTAD
jgi:hypothetical protein